MTARDYFQNWMPPYEGEVALGSIYLPAAPLIETMELVGKIREARIAGGNRLIIFLLTDFEAAALIEASDRTVPRAMDIAGSCLVEE